jgi:hypothetical protein
MSEVREPIDTEIDAVDVRELTDMELEAVSGGSPLVNVPINIQNTIQTNLPVQTAVAIVRPWLLP